MICSCQKAIKVHSENNKMKCKNSPTRRTWLNILLVTIVLAASEGNPSQLSKHYGVRRNRNEDHTKLLSREHVIRRVYGSSNAQARREISKVEDRNNYFRTGIKGDPNHIVPYKNHPYNNDNINQHDERRRQQEEVGSSDLFEPMRIHFYTQALDDMRTGDNGAKIDFIKSEILPRTADFWSQALSVVPVSDNLLISTRELDNNLYCGDSEFTEVPAFHITTGVPDTDVILYVSGTPSSRFCGGSTLAVAVACNFDQYDRPIAGAINFCLNQIDLADDGTAPQHVIDDNVDVAIHEAAHVLGVSSNSFRFFWDSETGQPRTPRPFNMRDVVCVDGVQRTLYLPDENTMKFFVNENTGKRHAMIVTPKVRTVARNQFDCQSLAGAQLENQPTGSQSCTGDHWDEKQYYPEALSGVISVTANILSHLTLALLEDAGWYKANYTMGQHSPWGMGAGCDFVTEACLIPGNPPTIPDYARGFFCNSAGKRGCSSALTHKLSCTVIDYNYILPRNLPDTQFQYFTNEITRGGPRQADFCPVYGNPYDGSDASQLSCLDPNNEASGAYNFFNEDYGEDSRCYETGTGEGRCFQTACVKQEMAVKVNVRGEWLTCEYDFQQLEVRIGTPPLPTTLTCPRLASACPDLFCPFMCAGRGICNYAATVNGTVTPKCECFDETDTSAGCSDSLVPDGNFLEDSADLLNNLEENFFDPLVAVFVDHPDLWRTASWAWAAGLLTVFLIMILCICSGFWPSNESRKDDRLYAI